MKKRKAPTVQANNPQARILKKAGTEIARILTKHNLRLVATFLVSENRIIPKISLDFMGPK